MKKKKKYAKQDLLIIDAETGLLSQPSTLVCVSPNSGILFPTLFGASSERITLYYQTTQLNVPATWLQEPQISGDVDRLLGTTKLAILCLFLVHVKKRSDIKVALYL